ncbi:MAG TPA: serpin family protein [Paludibacter sp.]|nr:serpin family protein [Paludibacter sp.]
MKTQLLFLCLVFLLASCKSENEPLPNAKPLQLRVGLQKRVVQDNEFAFDLLRQTIAEVPDTNVFMSPLSVSIALGMTMNGAKGDTRDEMETALKMSGLSVDDINEYYKVMQSELPFIDPKTKLSLANSIWYKQGYEVKKSFLDVNKNYFNAEVRELDFTQAWAVDTINNWCARKTNDLVKEVLDNIPGDVVMYLINAVYFKGIWNTQFDKKNTVESNFTNEGGKTVKVNMMQLKDTFAYSEDDFAQYLDLPYGNNAFSMTILLPKSNKSTHDVLNNMNGENWKTIVADMTQQEVDIYLPRFTNKNKFLLNKPLQNMGMVKAFGPGADLTNIADDDLEISRVLHDTFIDVNEEGTEAGAVTVVEIRKNAMPTIPVVRVNKPFIFVISEKSTGVILFIGKMGNLTKY